MAVQDETPEDDVLELTADLLVRGETEQAPEEGDREEVVVSFGDEAAPASEEAPEWVRDLRKQYREVVKERDELKKQVEAPKTIEVGPKPTLADCDYDEERFEQELEAWHGRESKAKSAQAEAEKAKAAVAEKYQAKLKAFGEQKDTLGAADFDDAEAEVLGTLNPVQLSVLIHGAENKATLVYALGKHPQKLRELASITDPIEFAFAAGRLEDKARMERRKVTTSPDSEVRGSASLSGGSDKTLERLEKEAERTGDRTQVIAYRKKLKARARG